MVKLVWKALLARDRPSGSPFLLRNQPDQTPGNPRICSIEKLQASNRQQVFARKKTGIFQYARYPSLPFSTYFSIIMQGKPSKAWLTLHNYF